jgi:uncharacterized protein (UPF0548 family)
MNLRQTNPDAPCPVLATFFWRKGGKPQPSSRLFIRGPDQLAYWSVFRLTQPTAAVIERNLAAASRLSSNTPAGLSLPNGLDPSARLPFGFVHNHSRSCIGHGEAAFAAARQAFRKWAMFDLGWARIANPTAPIEPGQIIAMEAQTLGLWTLNLSRIMETIDTASTFGFLYATTPMHVEQSAERFVLEFDATTGEVHYLLEAISRPRHLLARLGLPISRHFQHQFARESHRRIRQEVLAQ